MKTILTFSFMLMAWMGTITAQTKLIAHKSHSGSTANFKLALEHDLFDMDKSNFGAAPIEIITRARLDSLIFLSDSSAVMVTSDICRDRRRRQESPSIWQAGKDTVYFHPLFCQQHAKDSIKRVLDATYNFNNPADSVVFVGYDNHKAVVKIEPELPETLPMVIETKPSKREIRKAKKALKRKQRKERKAKKMQKQKTKEQPVIKPAAFFPIHNNDPKDPPGSAIWLKVLLIGLTGILAIVTGFYTRKYV